MLRLLVLPFAVEPSSAEDSGNRVLGEYLARDLARRLRVIGAVDAEAADPLGAMQGYSLQLAAEVAPLAVERLDLDGVLHVRVSLDEDPAAYDLGLLDGSATRSFEWFGQADVDELLKLNAAAASALHAAIDVEPSARELEAIEGVASTSLGALKCVAMAETLGREDPELSAQRIELLRTALRSDPTFVEAIVALAAALEEGHEVTEARAVLDDFLAEHPNATEVALESARQALRTGSPDRAIERASAVARDEPWRREAVLLLAQALVAAGQHDEACFVLQEALWRFGGDWMLRRVLVDALVSSSQLEAGRELLRELADEHPDDHRTRDDLAVLCAHTGAFGEAWELFGAGAGPERSGSTRSELTVKTHARLALALGRPAAALVIATAPNLGDAALPEVVSALLFLDEHTAADTLWSTRVTPTRASAEEIELAFELALATGDLVSVRRGLDSPAGRSASDAIRNALAQHWSLHADLLEGELQRAENALATWDAGPRQAALRRLGWLSVRASKAHDPSGAEAALALLILAQPEAALPIVRAARLRWAQGDPERALTWLGPVLDAAPPADAVLLAAQILLEDGRGDEAGALAEACAVRASAGRRAVYEACCAWVAAQLGDEGAVERHLGQALSGEAHSEAVWVIERMVATDTLALEQLSEAVRSAGWDARSVAGAAGLARLHLLLGQDALANALATACDEEQDPDLAFVRGLLAEAQGDGETAERHWRLAVGLQPDHHDALVHLAASLLVRGDAARALPLLEHAVLLDPDQLGVRGILHEAIGMRLGSWDRGE